MNEKNIYEILNRAKVPYEEPISDLSKEDKNKISENFLSSIERKKKRSFKKLSLVAAMFILLFSITGPGRAIIDNLIDLYDEMESPISDYSIEPKKIENLVTHIDKSVEDQGIKVTLRDAFRDGDTIYVNVVYEVVGGEILDQFHEDASPIPGAMMELSKDGQRIHDSSGTVIGAIPNNKSDQQFYKFELYPNMNIGDSDTLLLKQNYMDVADFSFLDFSKEDFGLTNAKRINVEGNWDMEFSIKDSSKDLNTRVIPVNESPVDIEKERFTIESIRINDFSIQIQTNYENPEVSTGGYSLLVTNDNEESMVIRHSSGSMRVTKHQIVGSDDFNFVDSDYIKIKPVVMTNYLSNEYKEVEGREITVNLR